MAHVVLWHFPISHFNEKVRWALDLKRIPHGRRALGLGYLPRALWATGRPTLPILFIDGKAISDSTRIIAALEELRPEPALYPPDPALRRRALELEDFFDEELGHPLRAALLGPLFHRDPDAAVAALTTGMGPGPRRAARAIWPAFRAFYTWRHRFDPADVVAERAKVQTALDRVAAELGPRGYLAGDAFSVADLTAAALFAPLVLPPELEYRPPAAPAMAEYRRALASHPTFGWVEEMYRRHRGRSAEVRDRPAPIA